MTNYRERWRAKQLKRTSRGPWLRLDHAQIEKDREGYFVTIRGFGLKPGPVPPEIRVDGMLLTDLRFSQDGRQVTGRLAHYPKSGKIVAELAPGLTGSCALDLS